MYDGHLTRIELDGEVEHRRGQQFVSGKGFSSDQFRQVHRIEPHGFASWPVKGGIATLLQSRGNRDSAYVFGGENPSMRPELTQGGTAIYDSHGNIVSVVKSSMRIVHGTAVHIVAPEIILEGNVKLGGPGASRPVSAEGTIDSGGDIDASNFATKVWLE